MTSLALPLISSRTLWFVPAFILSLFLDAGMAIAGSAADTAFLRIEFEGTLFYEAHYRRPGEVHPYHSRQTFSTDGRGNVRYDWTTWEDGDKDIAPESFLLTGGRIFHREAPDRPWFEYSGLRARRARLQACAGLPRMLDNERFAGANEHENWMRSNGRLKLYTLSQPHPRLGDVCNSVAFGYSGSDPVPTTLVMTNYSRDENWWLTARRLESSSNPLPDSLFEGPTNAAQAPPNQEDESLGPVPPFISISPGIWLADLADIDSRTLIAEFSDYLAVLEIGVSSANGERVVDAIRRQWPAKPVRYVLFSHYHPSYTGGLRALIAEGATVITTPGNADFVGRVARYPFRLQPDRLARHPKPLHLKTFTDRYVLGDAANQVVAFNYGARSQHTDEFVLFWFPRQRLLFETEQGWFCANGELRASGRARGLLSWIAERGLDVDRIVQSYPMRDTPAALTREKLASLADLRR